METKHQPLPTVVTPDVLAAARGKRDTKVDPYESFTVDFWTDAPKDIPEVCLKRPEKICDSALDLVGRTPMVRLTRLAEKYGIECELLGKCEFLSVGGSVKDRIGKLMIEEAEAKGQLQAGDLIVEATSGNTGIGLCLAASVKGYRTLITLPEKMSQEKSNMMVALGAEIVRTPTEAAWNAVESHIGLANQLAATVPRCHFLDQYKNPANPRAHYLGTGEEIIWQCDGKLDALVMTIGTGGTATGIAKRMKEKVPTCRIVGVDPKGSILALPDELNDEKRGASYLVEGIGYDFIPSTLKRDLIDEWVKTDDHESFIMARELIRLEGLLVGGSSGSALAAALRVAKGMKKGERCVILLPDSSRNYMMKFISDDWMIDNGFYPAPTGAMPYQAKTLRSVSLPDPVVISPSEPVAVAIQKMRETKSDQLPVVNGKVIVGVITEKAIANALLKGRISLNSSVLGTMDTKFRKVCLGTNLNTVAQMLVLHDFCVVVDENDELHSIVRRMDILSSL